MSSFDEYRKKLQGKYGKNTKSSEKEPKENEKEKTTTNVTDKVGSSFDEYRKKLNAKYATDKVTSDDVKTWFSEVGTTLQSMQDYHKQNEGKYTPEYGGDTAKKLKELMNSSGDIYNYLQNNRNEFSNFKEITDLFSMYRSALEENDLFNYETSRYYSQFNSEDEYNKWYEKNKSITELTESAINSDDFDYYSQVGANIKNPSAEEAEPNIVLFGKGFGGEKIGNIVTYSRDNANALALGEANGGGSYAGGKYLYTFMTDDEVAVYNYYLGKGENDKASAFLASLEDTLAQRHGGQIAENLKDHEFTEMLFGFSSGIEQAAYGLGNLDNLFTGAEADPLSASQYAAQSVRENMDGGWGVAYDLAQTTGNMLPSILASTVTGGVGGAVAGQVAGAVTQGISATGNAYAEMRRLGYDENQSRAYGIAIGISEAALQYAIGGIGKLGGKLPMKAVTNLASKIDKAIARTAIKLGGNILSEGIEEGIQTALEPAFKALATGETFEAAEWDDILYSSILGALSAGVMDGLPTLASTAYNSQKAYGKYGGMNFKNAVKELLNTDHSYGEFVDAYKKGRSNLNESASSLVSEALEVDPTNEHAKRMQNRLDKGKNVSGYQINRLVEANEQAYRTQDIDKMKSATAERLAHLGEQGDVSTLAEALVKQEIGESLSLSEKKSIKNSKFGQRVANELSSDNIKSGGYTSEWAEKIGTERINAEAYNKAISVDEEDIEATENAPVQENATEREFEASENGKTILKSTGEEVHVQGIESIENGAVKLKLDNGETVKASDVAFGSDDEALMYEMVVRMDTNPETAKAVLEVSHPSESFPAWAYLADVPLAYEYGKMNYEAGLSNLTIPEETARIAYNRGRIDAITNVKARQKDIDTKKYKSTSIKKGRVHYDGGILAKNLTDRQKASLKGLETLAEALGIEFHVFESAVNKNGKRKGANGWFDPKDGSIHIDLFAGQNGEGTMLFTAAHELTHFIREWSPAKFKVFADFLVEQYGKKGVPVEDLVREQIAKAKRNGRDIDYDTAYEEVIADACETMLADGDVVQKIAELKAKDKSLWQKIKDFITDLVAKIKKAYEGLSPDSQEGKYMAEMLDSAEKLKALWTEALVDASEAYTASDIVEIDADTESVAPTMMSERTWTESEYVTEREMTAKKISKELGVPLQSAYKYIDDINGVAKLIADDRARLDYEPNLDEKATVLKPNSEYKYSVDMSTLCAKRLLFTGTFDAIQRALPNTVFESEDIVSLRKMMQKRGYEVACGICYVESTRREIGRITQEFIDRYKVAQKTGEPISRINSNGKEVVLKSAGKTFSADKHYTPNLGELNTTDIDIVKRDHREVYDAYLAFMNARGQAKPKLLETRAEYKGEILKHFKAKSAVESRNKAGGLRLQSFSDFEVPHMIDMMQIVMDMSRVGLKSQAYTKVPAFAEIFGDSGVKINLSLIAKGDGLDAKGNLIFDDVEGINHKEAFKLRDKYSKNVGTILVGKTDAHIIAAMADPRIDYIIPFHKSSWKESLYDALGLTGYADYTDTQNEKPIDKSRAIKNFDPSEYWDFTKSGDENAQIYLEKCREDGRIPKFPQFQGYPGYWKLLIDFKMYGNDGVGSPQEVVKPVFNTEASERILGEYKGGHNSFPVAEDVVEDFVKEQRDKVKYSDRDSSYMDAVNRGDMETAQRMVDEAAREAGYKIHAYHGTNAEFTVFDTGKQGKGVDQFGAGFYFANNSDVSERYGNRMIESYLKLEKPIRILRKGERGNLFDVHITKAQAYQVLKRHPLMYDPEESPLGDFYEEYWEVGAKEWMVKDLAGRVTSIGELDSSNMLFRNYPNELHEALHDICGFDGVQIHFETDAMVDERNDEYYVTWFPEQAKTADPVTYDENGNVIPISERFSAEDNDIRYSFRGTNKDGIEVYETSEAIKKLPIKERQKAFLDIMKKEYRGRTAKFIRNGHTYYASFDYRDIGKNIYGDKLSDKKGWKAKINVGAEGEVFELVENAKYNGSKPESGKNSPAHSGVGYWDYFVKTVQIDNIVFDLLANVRKKSDGQFVYSIQLNENKKIEASPSLGSPNGVLNRMLNASVDSVPQDSESVKREFSDADTKYSIREEDPPKKTIEGYKVFVVKNGKLYPPMVANPNAEDTPVGLWLNADVGTRAPDSKTGRAQVKAGGKGTQGGSGSLAFRPGWHLGETPLATQFDRTNPETGVKELFPENFVWALCDIAADHDYQEEAMSYGYTKNGKFQHSLAGLPKLPVDGYYRYRTNPNPDTVPWLITGAMKVKKLLSDAEVNAILTEQGLPPKQRVGGDKTLADLGLSQYDGKLFSDRDPNSVSNRSLLANALESVAQNDIERSKLNEYKNKISLIESEQKKLAETRKKIKELSFAKGKRDTETINKLQLEANQSANRINTYDRQLLNLESTKALKGVLEREKVLLRKRLEQKGKKAINEYREKAKQDVKELSLKYQESRKKGIESRHKTEMRRKIRDVVNELNQYLLKGTKEKHVPIELQSAVAEALDAVNMDTVGAEERIAKKREEMMRAKTPEAVEKISKEIRNIEKIGGNMEEKLSRLKTAYDSIINSDDPLFANSHDEVISNTITKVVEVVGNTPLRDMSLYQLEAVYDMYKMVLASIRNANKAFKAEKGKEISVLANTVISDLDGKKRNPLNPANTKFAWNNLKPVYAFERIGSNTLTKLFNAVRAGEDVWAIDMTEAQAFREEQAKKNKFNSWDFEKKYAFKTLRGKSFELDIGEIMSLYAFAKDPHSKGHLIGEGFVFDPNKEVVKEVKGKIKVKVNLNDADSYNLSDEILADIISKLTPEQKAFADAMQDYLSTTMGEKGNEVSLELYDIKLFKNKDYFPLKVAPQYMAVAKEKAQGDVKIKNKGFTKDRKEGAKNPIVLSSFMDVWADHVNEMSMYHAFTLPLEDFYRVFNYKTPRMEGYAPMSVNASIQNAYGDGATSYIDQLLKDLNGGARVDPTVGIINKMTGLFKKSAVFASLSVVVQQPSAIARATALVDSKYFVGKPSKGKHKETWAEVKKYAPVAIIKEMGYFDTGIGKSSTDWLKGEKTWKDKVDDVASKAPALADEFAWCAIWNAVKRETLHTHKDLKPNSDEFLTAVGERFTEVITKTQVYDSVMSRSGNMRSKDTGMKMATAFMGEPTTSINMLQDALTQFKRGNKKYTAKAIGAVVTSMILNAILVSFVYAGRDDDEDKTYAEKYIGTLTEELLDSIKPLTLIPFLKDIVSIANGYDVERSDMAVVTDIIKAWNNLDSDNRSVYRKVEDFAGAIASILRLPVKNVMRDARGIYNTVNSFINGEQTTVAGIKNSLYDAVTGNAKSDGQQLYEAMVNGDDAQIERVKGRFKDNTAISTAIRKALRDNDPRIKEAAEARYNGDISGYMKIAKEIIAEGHFKQDDIVSAINAEINALKKGEGESDSSESTNKAASIYKMDDYYAALVGRDEATAYVVKEDIIKTDVSNGKDRDEAEYDFNSRFVSHLRELHEKGELSDYDAEDMLVEYGGKSEEDASSKVQYWKFKKQYPDYDLSEESVKKYYEEVEPYGIGISVYYDYTKQRAKCKGTDSNGDGKTDSGSVKAEVLRVIDSLPISNEQKDVLYYLNGWSEKTLYESPWY